MLTALIAIPLIGALIISLLPRRSTWGRPVALMAAALDALLVIDMLAHFHSGTEQVWWLQVVAWIPTIHADYRVGVDGISLSLIAVTALIGLLAVIASGERETAGSTSDKSYFAWLLVLLAAVYGIFSALDYLLFFVFWELLLVPSYFLIATGKGARARQAALRFFLYTFLGSAFLLIGILLIYQQVQGATFDMLWIAQHAHFSAPVQDAAFILLGLGFAVKMPLFPLHGWLRESYSEAPAPVTMLLSGIVAKVGAYGFFRIAYPTLPHAATTFSLTMAALGTVTILYGAFVAFTRRSPMEMFAYASLSHMGFVALGLAALTPMALDGALFVMISHALLSPLLFYMVGDVFAGRAGAVEFGSVRGLYTAMPIAGVIFGFAALANLGLPGLSAFVGEFFTIVGTYPVLGGAAVLAAISLVFTAAYNLRAIRQLLMGSSPPHALRDLGTRELSISAPLVLGVAVLGVFPALVMTMFDEPVIRILAHLGGI